MVWPQQNAYESEDGDGIHRTDSPRVPPPSAFTDISAHLEESGFNTVSIEDAYSDPGRDQSPPRQPWWKQRRTMAAFSAVLFITIVLAVGITAAGHGPASGTPQSHNKDKAQSFPNTLDSEEPLIGSTSNGPKEPVIELTTNEVNENRDEFGSTLVAIYDKLTLDWLPLSKADSPQSRSLLFVTGSSTFDMMPEAKKLQRYILGTFYYATFMQPHAFWEEPTDWISSVDWMTDEDECNWEGIICDEQSGKVTGIILPQNALSGYIPLELALLDELQELNLSTNFIHMTESKHDGLRVFGMLTKLVKLEMDDNYILTEGTGLPSSFGNLVNLQRLTMSYNLLQGPIDGSVVENLQALTHLEIESNYLSGRLPFQLGQLPKLYYIYLRRNLLDIRLGELFDSSENAYKNIFSLWLDDNQVIGGIPASIGRLSGLASFSITNTTLSGSIPTEIGECSDLQRIWLYNNDLTGELPWTLEKLKNLQVMEIYNNAITGKVPKQVCNSIQLASYEYKALAVDCGLITCPIGTCCTECY